MLETRKKVVIVSPTCVNESPKASMSHGKSGGIMKWKKCEVPCAKPTSEMTVASLRKLAAGVAADMGGWVLRGSLGRAAILDALDPPPPWPIQRGDEGLSRNRKVPLRAPIA